VKPPTNERYCKKYDLPGVSTSPGTRNVDVPAVAAYSLFVRVTAFVVMSIPSS
jgi:hypothetical protein